MVSGFVDDPEMVPPDNCSKEIFRLRRRVGFSCLARAAASWLTDFIVGESFQGCRNLTRSIVGKNFKRNQFQNDWERGETYKNGVSCLLEVESVGGSSGSDLR